MIEDIYHQISQILQVADLRSPYHMVPWYHWSQPWRFRSMRWPGGPQHYMVHGAPHTLHLVCTWHHLGKVFFIETQQIYLFSIYRSDIPETSHWALLIIKVLSDTNVCIHTHLQLGMGLNGAHDLPKWGPKSDPQHLCLSLAGYQPPPSPANTMTKKIIKKHTFDCLKYFPQFECQVMVCSRQTDGNIQSVAFFHLLLFSIMEMVFQAFASNPRNAIILAPYIHLQFPCAGLCCIPKKQRGKPEGVIFECCLKYHMYFIVKCQQV